MAPRSWLYDFLDEVCRVLVKSMLVKVGWKKDMTEENVPFLPISGWVGDKLLKQYDSTRKLGMDWWKGTEVEACGSQIMVKTLDDFLDKI